MDGRWNLLFFGDAGGDFGQDCFGLGEGEGGGGAEDDEDVAAAVREDDVGRIVDAAGMGRGAGAGACFVEQGCARGEACGNAGGAGFAAG